MNIIPQIELAITQGRLLKRLKNTKGTHNYINPIELAIPALLSVSGGPKEIVPYYQNTSDNISDIKVVFKGILYHTANAMLTHNKKLGEMALNHPAIRDKIHVGPLARLTYPEKTTRALGLLFVDTSTYLGLRNKGNMDWDDGTYETAMAISYLWRRVMTDKFKLTQSHNQVHFETRIYLKNLLKKYPDQPFVRFVEERFKMAWYLKNDPQKKEVKNYFSTLSKIKGTDDTSKLWRLLSNSSLIDFGLRYPDPELLQESFENLESDLEQKIIEQPAIQLAKAKMFAQIKDTTSVKKIALKLSKYNSIFYKKESIQLYNIIGDTKKSTLLQKQLLNTQNYGN
ncbi:hypothetical protein [Aquimarina muelleri]|nr:hypothetical protein [Aquimarina muelleri]MCX2763085.1 hypothetical protein [Aquimarina muelleri]